jgi:hypothetical protein
VDTCHQKKRKREEAQASNANTPGAQMPSAPKKSSKKKVQLTPEEQELLVKKRKEAIESRLLRLEAKIAKDRALLEKYNLPHIEETACAC